MKNATSLNNIYLRNGLVVFSIAIDKPVLDCDFHGRRAFLFLAIIQDGNPVVSKIDLTSQLEKSYKKDKIVLSEQRSNDLYAVCVSWWVWLHSENNGGFFINN